MPLSARRAQPYRLFRVDDRLLHGQVALGWGRHLGPLPLPPGRRPARRRS